MRAWTTSGESACGHSAGGRGFETSRDAKSLGNVSQDFVARCIEGRDECRWNYITLNDQVAGSNPAGSTTMDP
jgi:hypothetical protein